MTEPAETKQQEGLDNILEKEIPEKEESMSPAKRYPYEGEGVRCKDESDIIDKIFRVIVANIAAIFSSGILFGFLEASEVINIPFGHPLQLGTLVLLAGVWYKLFTKMGLFNGK
jgi:hypothetical protein